MVIRERDVFGLLDEANSVNSISVNHRNDHEAYDDLYNSLSPLIGGHLAFKTLCFVPEVNEWLEQHYSDASGVQHYVR